jgi:hypothetical protein
MKKTMLMAATFLALGVGAALAGDGDVNAPPPANTQTSAQQTQSGPGLFPTSTRSEVSVQAAFGDTYARGQP